MNDGKKERERKMGEMYQIKVNTGSRAHVIYKKKKKFLKSVKAEGLSPVPEWLENQTQNSACTKSEPGEMVQS